MRCLDTSAAARWAGRLGGLAFAACLLGLTSPLAPALALDGIVEKKTFEMPSYTTVGGGTIKNVRIGWESYGTLNEAKDNVILVTHFFSGSSHAAGKYKADDPAPGYWDSIIGPGKPLDTDKYFIISSDTLVNLSPKDPTVVTTGPASTNPDTGKPYGLSFPVVAIRDFVNVQKALLDSLGVTSLQAVMGGSMGSLQALDWATAHPDMVKRVIAAIGGAEADPFLIGWLNLWAAPIKLDPNWNNGDYYGKAEPKAGLTEALKLVTLHARHWKWADAAFGRKWAEEGKDPRAALGNQYAIEAWLEKAAASRAAVSDANHFLYLVKANQTFVAGNGGSLEDGLAKIKAPVLLLPSADDLVFPPDRNMRPLKERLEKQGNAVEYSEAVTSTLGHLDGVANIAKAGDSIAAFLAK
ncbi:E22 family MetX-like putative esterase [Azospirillum agricola]|uniref:E22 family MetX-like putative esterase n=1 Tax=Azospirillum agricola TaxID=1720247 RepID=UPI000A0F1317|nr:homoserine O-acetyltransferase [Azospirillum agricola]SMH44952.1 homoserine O-acetyltransferase [Azospirillum lipoferum]